MPPKTAQGIYYSGASRGPVAGWRAPHCHTPEAWTRDLCIAYVAAVNDARVGDLAGPNVYGAHRPYRNAPLAASFEGDGHSIGAAVVSAIYKSGAGVRAASIRSGRWPRLARLAQGHCAYVPTWTAFAVTNLLERHFGHLVDYSFTATMEESLDVIAARRG